LSNTSAQIPFKFKTYVHKCQIWDEYLYISFKFEGHLLNRESTCIVNDHVIGCSAKNREGLFDIHFFFFFMFCKIEGIFLRKLQDISQFCKNWVRSDLSLKVSNYKLLDQTLSINMSL